ncbi:MAG: cysteine desulfurase [Immundisolibacteraceae bacterium]|nr:cysteine desulfurase [Immundisolibacteraceae bacterium]
MNSTAVTDLNSDDQVAQWRADFPILKTQVNGHPLVYLDNGATTQKPQVVIDAVSHYYENTNSNIHRGVHQLSELATAAYENGREQVRRFIGAASEKEVVFTRGTTESINLVANSWGMANLKAGDEVLVTEMEHHSNIVPWQMVTERTGAQLKVIPINDAGEISLDDVRELISDRTKMVAISQLSNALGTINPVQEVIEMAHQAGALVLVDGAQAIAHIPVDMADLDCDFYAFSGHKIFGPTGTGVLYGKEALLEAMPPWQGGGDMIRTVRFEKSTWNDLPYKFEAGTPNIAGGIGLGVALDYVSGVGLEKIAAHETELLNYASRKLQELPGLKLIGTAKNRASIASFVLDQLHAHDLGTILDSEGIAIRAGHHCAMPVMQHYGVAATARASFAFYNTFSEVDRLMDGLNKAVEMFG